MNLIRKFISDCRGQYDPIYLLVVVLVIVILVFVFLRVA